MSWRDDFRDGSFRGAAFKIVEHEHGFGRRQDVHEYPLRDAPYAEDLGGKAGSFRVQCLVIGDDYMADRDALIAACNAIGPGTLIHPYLGSKIVSCRDGRVRESEEEGGAAFFEIEFVQAGQNIAPGISEATQDSAGGAADNAADQAATALDSDLIVAEQPEFVRLSAVAQVTGAIGVIGDALAKVTDLGGQLKADFQETVDGVLASVDDLVDAPLALAGAVQGLMSQLRELANTPREAFAALSDLLDYGFDPPTVTGTTPSRIQEATNIDAVVRFIRRSAACEMVRAAAAISFDSYQDAVITRDQFAERLDDLLYDAGAADDDEAFALLRALRLKMARDITARGGSLARLFTYVPAESQPALLITHRLYGDATRDVDIIERNGVAHPGFVAAGEGLEVPSAGIDSE